MMKKKWTQLNWVEGCCIEVRMKIETYVSSNYRIKGHVCL